ncbi:MAG: winged helix-turn-helix domain-containing protein [Desulfobacterales bacterium]|nr:winged helix-turn-helix domain-containing protein [Desulfobacterales bacterium]
MSTWTFVTNHAVVLSYLAHHPSITARELAADIGITERAVRRIIKDLETEGYLTKTRKGRGAHYSIRRSRPLRHRSQQNNLVGDLLKVLRLQSKPVLKPKRRN